MFVFFVLCDFFWKYLYLQHKGGSSVGMAQGVGSSANSTTTPAGRSGGSVKMPEKITSMTSEDNPKIKNNNNNSNNNYEEMDDKSSIVRGSGVGVKRTLSDGSRVEPLTSMISEAMQVKSKTTPGVGLTGLQNIERVQSVSSEMKYDHANSLHGHQIEKTITDIRD